MFDPKDIVTLDTDPLADKDDRTAVVMGESEYTDWAGNARYNVVCLSTDFDEYEDHPHTTELDKNEHTDTGSLEDHSLICPWATMPMTGQGLIHVNTDRVHGNSVTLTDKGHELVAATVYKFFSDFNNYQS